MLKSNGNLMIFILTIGVFSIINTEMGVIGILPLLAERFGVSIPQAGLLISLFALAVAFSGPVMPLLFSGMERKKVMLLVLGLKFLFIPVTSTRRTLEGESLAVRVVKGVAGGTVIGLICGFFGAGGGMMMLMVLTMLLGYELKTAVGTSVFVMTFSALTGAVSHFALDSPPRMDLLILCVIFTLLWAQIAAKIATRADAKLLNRLTGAILTILGVILVALNFF